MTTASLSIEALPLGFRFRPTDEELINHYLRLKINGRDSEVRVVPEVDVCKWEPWDLPGLSVIKTDDQEWFFFCPRDRKYPSGHRSNRATDTGYWKATGKDRTIKCKKKAIGMKKTLVFYRGRAPRGERTNWIMHEYRATDEDLDGSGPGQNPYVLCRLFHKPSDSCDTANCDELENVKSTPTSTKSIPDDTSSEMIQETATSRTQALKESDDTERYSSDKSDDVKPGDPLSDRSIPNRDTSHTENCIWGKSLVEEYPLVRDIPNLYGPSFAQIGNKTSCPTHSSIGFAASHMDSLYASDFGNSDYGLHFQDGASLQDISLTEVLDEVFRNNNKTSGEESTKGKDVAIPRMMHLAGNTGMLSAVNPFLNDAVPFVDRDAEAVGPQYVPDIVGSRWVSEPLDSKDLVEMQTSSGSSRTFTPVHGHALEQQAPSSYATIDPFHLNSNHLELPAVQQTFVDCNVNPDDITGFKAKARQHQPNLDFSVDQGTAPRRLRLQIEKSRASVSYKKDRAADYSEEDEVQSAISEAEDDERFFHDSDKTSVQEHCSRFHSVNSGIHGTARRRIRLQMRLQNPLSNINDTVRDSRGDKRGSEEESTGCEEKDEDPSGHLKLRVKHVKSTKSQLRRSLQCSSSMLSVFLVMVVIVILVGIWGDWFGISKKNAKSSLLFHQIDSLKDMLM